MNNIIPFNYEGHSICFNDDGWLNATDVTMKFGKEPNDWLRQIDTLEYLAALSSKLFSHSGFLTEISKIKQLDTSSAASRAKVLKFVKKTGLVKTKTGPQGGTWLHPKLAVRLARWLSVEFEIWCDEQIDVLIRGTQPIYDDHRINAIFLLDKPVSMLANSCADYKDFESRCMSAFGVKGQLKLIYPAA